MQRAALAFLEHPSRGLAVLGAVAKMIERAGLPIGPRFPPAVALPPPSASSAKR